MTKYLLLFILLFPLKFFSQQSTITSIKSPQVNLLKQFGDYPVDLSRGLVDVSIPLHEIDFGNTKLPLSIKFHPSGLKANASENGILGLKWVLNIGGFVSREVRGYPDERNNHKQGILGEWFVPDWITLYGGSADKGYLNNNMIFKSQDLSQLGMPGVYGKYEDTEYDIFTFSLPNGKSGKFLWKDVNGVKTAAFLPYQPFKVNFYTESLYNSQFHVTIVEITDDQGYVYKFGKNESNKPYYETAQDYSSINCWYLNSIVSPNKKDIIKFEYNNTSINGNSPLTPVIINDQLETGVKYWNSGSGCDGNTLLFDAIGWDLYTQRFVENYNFPPFGNQESCYLTKITYNNLIINFNHQQNSNDINNFLLDNIEIIKNNEILKKINFETISQGRPITELPKPSYLNSVSIKDKDNQIIERYKFDYYNIDKLPYMTKLTNSADYWGYYNSQVKNVILKDTVSISFRTPVQGCYGGPAMMQYFEEIGEGDNRYSNTDDMKIGMIKSITYPTGGITTFDYEANQYNTINQSNYQLYGGLRIKNLVESDNAGRELKRKEFTYGLNEDGIGEVPSYLQPDIYNKNPFEETATEWKIIDMAILGAPGEYYFRNQSAEAIYRSRYFTGFFPSNYYTFLDKLVSYDKVTEYLGGKLNNIGKIENYYSNTIPQQFEYDFDNRNFIYQKNNRRVINPANFWSGNHIDKKIEYKKENGNYVKTKQTEFIYQDDIVDEIFDLSIFTYKRFFGFFASNEGNDPDGGTIPKDELQRIKDNPGEYFGYKTKKYTVGVENLTEIKEKFYFGNDSIVQTTTNIYDANKPTFLKESLVVNSKGKNLSQKYLYPFNVNTGVYSDMTTANVISPVVEKVSLNDTNVTGSTLLTYKKSDANFVPNQNYVTELMNPIAYSGFSMFNGTTKDSHYSSYAEITYDSYDDFGNPTQLTSKGGVVTSFIWGYDKKYPVAKIENVIYSTIPSTLLTAIETASSSTGSEASLITALTNLRNDSALANAMVTTYTYKPLIGMSSMTDPKGYVTYYEYDSYGRLQQVKDKDNNILSKNEYHYKN